MQLNTTSKKVFVFEFFKVFDPNHGTHADRQAGDIQTDDRQTDDRQTVRRTMDRLIDIGTTEGCTVSCEVDRQVIAGSD